MTPLSR